jgi:hypothetical protein
MPSLVLTFMGQRLCTEKGSRGASLHEVLDDVPELHLEPNPSRSPLEMPAFLSARRDMVGLCPLLGRQPQGQDGKSDDLSRHKAQLAG